MDTSFRRNIPFQLKVFDRLAPAIKNHIWHKIASSDTPKLSKLTKAYSKLTKAYQSLPKRTKAYQTSSDLTKALVSFLKLTEAYYSLPKAFESKRFWIMCFALAGARHFYIWIQKRVIRLRMMHIDITFRWQVRHLLS